MKRQFILGMLLIFLSVITVNAQEKLSNQELNRLEQLGRKGSIKAYQKLADYYQQKGNTSSAKKYLAKIKEIKKAKQRKQRKTREGTSTVKNWVIQGLYQAGALNGNNSESTKKKKEAYDFVKNVALKNVYSIDTPNSFKSYVVKVYINKYANEYYLFFLNDLYPTNPYRKKFTCVDIVKVTSDSRASLSGKPFMKWKEEPNGY